MRKKLKQLLVIIMTACILFTSMLWDGLAIDAAEVATMQQPKKNSSSKKNITMKVLYISKKKIKLKFTNKGSQDFDYSLLFTLEKRVKGKWKKVKFKKDAKFPKCLFVLKGNSSITKKIIWKQYFDNNLSKGKYRIKWIHNKVFRIK